jgi:serine/threonine-protein kinase
LRYPTPNRVRAALSPTDSPSQTDASDAMIGQAVGGYTLVRRLGRGNMGDVYAAERAAIGRHAAVKLLSAECSANAELARRFFAEARTVNAIRHPNIIDITDFGKHEDRFFIVMELLDGESLAERMARSGPLDDGLTVSIAAQVASALGAAHEHGIIHRDLKPENIFLVHHPDMPHRVKVLDFGIAKLVDKRAVGATDTNVGAILGTPLYMSPEQCLGDKSLDHRSDIYSLGVVIFQMLVGAPPFPGDGIGLGSIIQGHMRVPVPSLKAVVPEVPDDLADAVTRALAKDPDDRFANMADLRAALLATLSGPSRKRAAVPTKKPATHDS